MKSSKELIKLAKELGWVQERSKGSHRAFKKGDTTVMIVVKNGKELPKGTSLVIEKRLRAG